MKIYYSFSEYPNTNYLSICGYNLVVIWPTRPIRGGGGYGSYNSHRGDSKWGINRWLASLYMSSEGCFSKNVKYQKSHIFVFKKWTFCFALSIKIEHELFKEELITMIDQFLAGWKASDISMSLRLYKNL